MVRCVACCGIVRLASRSVAMTLTGHKTEAVCRRYAIVSSGDLADASRKLQVMTATVTGTIGLISDNAESTEATRRTRTGP